ncbi:hypothetical protein DY000_02042959 [Brassica cretica]|uniref:Uncharacterized protein n=1 Tax=Brassica cretica TaxID=69181 RepID=A0ABQ7BNZ2_BRACR|nr:hypothetical protein DY000_02042959 [Brassica cretica]
MPLGLSRTRREGAPELQLREDRVEVPVGSRQFLLARQQPGFFGVQSGNHVAFKQVDLVQASLDARQSQNRTEQPSSSGERENHPSKQQSSTLLGSEFHAGDDGLRKPCSSSLSSA